MICRTMIVLGGSLLLCVLSLMWLPGCGSRSAVHSKTNMDCRSPFDRFVCIDGVNYHYQEYPGPGRDVFLLHGFSSSTYTWEKVAPRLFEKGYHVWTLDMKGFGWSDKPTDEAYDPMTLMEEVNRFMEVMGLRQVVFVGNSLGGAIGWLTALLHPDKVERLVLIDAAGYPMKKPLPIRAARLPLAETLARFFFSRGLVRHNLKEVFHNDSLVTDELVEAYYTRLASPGALHAQTALARSLNFKDFEPFILRIPEIKAETLLIWGREDQWIPTSIGCRFREDLPRASLVVIPECGHTPQEEQPALTTRLILEFMETGRIAASEN